MVTVEEPENRGENGVKVAIFSDLPRLLRRLREAAGMEQSAAGAAIGKSGKAISHYERGIVSPQLAVVDKLLELYGVNSMSRLAVLLEPVDEVRESAASELRHLMPGESAEYLRGLSDAYARMADAADRRK